MAAITILLSPEEHDRLRLIAERERRHLSQQAAFLLVDAELLPWSVKAGQLLFRLARIAWPLPSSRPGRGSIRCGSRSRRC